MEAVKGTVAAVNENKQDKLKQLEFEVASEARYSVAQWAMQALKLIRAAIKPHLHHTLSVQRNLGSCLLRRSDPDNAPHMGFQGGFNEVTLAKPVPGSD